jgi:predicted nucleic acid-binding protein
MYQIVLDTNVLVAAMRSKQGASYRLLSLLA